MWMYKSVVCALILGWARAEQEVQLEIPQGELKGIKTETVFNNIPYYSFKGIPYAKPNVGPNKFQMPEPADPWEGVYDATVHRNACPFYCMLQKSMIGDEDCLYLNVDTPTLDKEAGKAVMVWLHPGLWNAGFGHREIFAPDFLVEQDVILVTFDYRLGALGFLNTEDKNAPGNAGMKDQVMALKWVKDNIHYFGGCPNRVTIFGVDAGAASVQYHLMSPMSEGLFSAGIIQSGSLLNPWAISYNPRKLAFMLGEALGIQTTDSAELVQKLTEFSVEELIAASNEVMKSENALDGRLFAFVPSIENDLGQDVFLPADPWTLIKSGQLANIPLMAGVARDEGTTFAHVMASQIDLLNDQAEKFLPIDLNITNADMKKELGESLRSFYFGNKAVTMDSMDEFTKLLSDMLFNAGMVLSLQVINARNSAPIYEYLLSYEPSFGYMKFPLGISNGAVHGDELSYLFYSDIFKNVPERGSVDEKMTRIMTKMWANFAKDNNPTSTMDEDITVNWEPKGDNDDYMNIDTDLKMDKKLFDDRMSFWKEMYQEILGDYARN